MPLCSCRAACEQLTELEAAQRALSRRVEGFATLLRGRLASRARWVSIARVVCLAGIDSEYGFTVGAERFAAMLCGSGQRVSLNVGGVPYETTLGTICSQAEQRVQ